jgi:hypothetical protein
LVNCWLRASITDRIAARSNADASACLVEEPFVLPHPAVIPVQSPSRALTPGLLLHPHPKRRPMADPAMARHTDFRWVGTWPRMPPPLPMPPADGRAPRQRRRIAQPALSIAPVVPPRRLCTRWSSIIWRPFSPRRRKPTPWAGVSDLGGTGLSRLPPLRHLGSRVRAGAMHGLRARPAPGLLMQGSRRVPVM